MDFPRREQLPVPPVVPPPSTGIPSSPPGGSAAGVVAGAPTGGTGFDWQQWLKLLPLILAPGLSARTGFLSGWERARAIRTNEQQDATRIAIAQQQVDQQQRDQNLRAAELAEAQRAEDAKRMARLIYELSTQAQQRDEPADYAAFVEQADRYLGESFPGYRPGTLAARAPFNAPAAQAAAQKAAAATVQALHDTYGERFWHDAVQQGRVDFRGRSVPVSELVKMAGIFPETATGEVITPEGSPAQPLTFVDLFPQAAGSTWATRAVPLDPKGLPDYREALEVARGNGWVKTTNDLRQLQEGIRDAYRAKLLYAVRHPGEVDLAALRKAMAKAGMDWDVERDTAQRRSEREGLELERLKRSAAGSPFTGLFDEVPGEDDEATVRAAARQALEQARAAAADARPVTEAEIDQLLAIPGNREKLRGGGG